MTNDLTYPADAMRAANAEAERLRDELTRLKKQRRELWMLLDHIDTLDDACRDHDDAFRNFTRKHQKQRFNIWNPESDAEVLSLQQRAVAWSEEAFREHNLGDGTVEEAIEIAQACGVPSNVLHQLLEYLYNYPSGDEVPVLGKCLLALYSLGFDADAALETELAWVQQPEGMEKVRQRLRTIRAENLEARIGFDTENALALGAVDTESVRENQRLDDIVSKKRAGNKSVTFDTDDLLTKYEYILKLWPANTLDILVRSLTGSRVQYFITNRPTSATALFDELKSIHKDREEAEYEIKIVDINTREFRGMGRIVMPDTR
ncbi:hypothetical protein LCGC14_1058720 [marine sediment metagenome]|uniref:Uncharacterized protein n=1 Tax=marine sediment metagenome TaxID=412755 RepID=A0A0F9QSN2_9ZZZZ